jgi:hypothetical protein
LRNEEEVSGSIGILHARKQSRALGWERERSPFWGQLDDKLKVKFTVKLKTGLQEPKARLDTTMKERKG